MGIDREKILGTEVDWRACFAYLRRNHTTKLRVFEYPGEDGRIIFAHPFAEHYLPGCLPISSCICRKEMFTAPCVFCTINQLAHRGVRRILFPIRRSFIINAMDIDAPFESIDRYLIPYVVFNRIFSYMPDGEPQNILEFNSCRIFAIESSGQGLEKRYTTKLMLERALPLRKKFKKQIVRPSRLIKDPSFQTQLYLLNDYLQSESRRH